MLLFVTRHLFPAPERELTGLMRAAALHFPFSQCLAIITFAFCFVSGVAGAGDGVAAEARARIARSHPPIAKAIERSWPTLGQELSAEEQQRSLNRVAQLCENPDPECQLALRIISDGMKRSQTVVQNLTVDGNPSEWSNHVPAPRSVLVDKEDPGRDPKAHWPYGAGAVVRGGWLYMFLGTSDLRLLKEPGGNIAVWVDCEGGPRWDVFLRLEERRGALSLTRQMVRAGQPLNVPEPIRGARIAVGAVVEIAARAEDVIPAERAKPIWTLTFKTNRRENNQPRSWLVGHVPALNESAQPGVGADPYVCGLIRLAADTALDDLPRTAAAIAITAAYVEEVGDGQVRTRLRRDNVEMLDLAREIVREQRSSQYAYCLADYPLEVQLAWADRLSGWRSLDIHRGGPAVPAASLDSYVWAAVSPGTLREFRALVKKEGLVTNTVSATAQQMIEWTRTRIRTDVDAAQQREVVGSRNGAPVRESEIHGRSAIYVERVLSKGQCAGDCAARKSVVADFCRSAGVAILGMYRKPARQTNLPPHVWAVSYEPASRLWVAGEPGGGGFGNPGFFRNQAWLLGLNRPAVYPWAKEAPALPLPRLPLTSEPKQCLGPSCFYQIEMSGADLIRVCSSELSAVTVRSWMLEPCF